MPANIVYDAILGAGNTLHQVMSTSFNAGLAAIVARSSGLNLPASFFQGTTQPTVTFQNADIAGLLGFVDVTAGLYVAAGTITIPFHLRSNGAAFGSGSVNNTLTSANGLIVPESFSAAQDQEAVTASTLCHFLSADGFATPVAFNTSQALASETFNAQYGFGPAYFGGSQITECVGWTVTPGITVDKHQIDGGIYPTRAYITLNDPTIDIIFEDFAAASAVAAGCAAGAMTTAAVYGLKRATAGFVSTSTSVHLKFSFGTGITAVQTISCDGVNAGRYAVRLYGLQLTASSASTVP